MKIIYLLSLFLCFNAVALSEGVLPATEWQKKKLVQDINEKLERRLDPIIKDKKYLIDISITTSMPQKPDFSLSGAKEPKKHIRYNNIAPDKSNGDYIVFSKFGLEVPSIAAIENDSADKSEKSEYEFLWKYNQSLNIFTNIEDLRIKLTLTDRLPEDKRDEIKDLVNKTDLGIGEIKPNYTFEYVNFEIVPAEILTAQEKKASRWELLGKFSNAIGLLLASLILGAFGFMLMKKFEQIKKDEKAKEGQINQGNQPHEEKKEHSNEMNLSSSNMPSDETTSGIERFQNYFDKNPEGATFLIKRWINSGSDEEKKALFFLVKALDNRNLIQIFDKMTINERESWKQTLSDIKTFEFNQSSTDHFISTQVVEEMIVPNMIKDSELQESLMSLTDTNAAQFIKNHHELGPYLIELLSNKRVSSILNFMEPNLVKDLLKQSSKITKEDINLKIEEMKLAMTSYSKPNKDNSFIQKICELLLLSSGQNDEALYESLRDENAWEAIKKMARRVYPSFLIKSLPQKNLQQLLASYPHQKKSQLLYTLEESERHHFLNSIGEKGSTVREMLEIEIENFEMDKEAGEKLMLQKFTIWEDFVQFSRKQIMNTIESTPVYMQVVHQWMSPEAEIINFPRSGEETLEKEA